MKRIHRRSFLQQSAAVAALTATRARAQSVNEQLNIGIIGVGGRGNELLKSFGGLPDVRIAALCDPDAERLHQSAVNHPQAATYADLRKLLDDRNIDAVAVATCNHWHALATIWACQAGKDVYVEKPLAHNHWEGQQVVRAARKYDRIVQVGTQQRSDPLQEELKDYLHERQQLGAVRHATVCRFGVRGPIGKRAAPMQPPPSVDYDLWLGPAVDQPIYRDKLHYDWHWDWNTGNGEMGNWGVHVLDDAINVVLRDRVAFPKRVAAAGGRVAWDDAGDTPNACLVIYDTGNIPIVFAMSNLPDKTEGRREVEFDGMKTGYIVYCEGGRYDGGRGGGTARDRDGKVLRRFRGDSGRKHARNFVDAVLARDRKMLNAEVQIGHQATAWCNLANVAIRTANAEQVNYRLETAGVIGQGFAPWQEVIEHMEQHVAKNDVDLTKDFCISSLLTFDGGTEQFTGPEAERANAFLRREYRSGFAVPEIA